jgi:hypothetical protein
MLSTGVEFRPLAAWQVAVVSMMFGVRFVGWRHSAFVPFTHFIFSCAH